MRIEDYKFNGVSIISYKSDIIDSMSYLICINESRIIIDPHIDSDLLPDLYDSNKLIVILTHEHFDHISGVNWLRELFEVNVYASSKCSDKINSKRNGTELFPLLLIGDKNIYDEFKKKYHLPYRCKIDTPFSDCIDLDFEKHNVHIFETPGHSMGSISILIDNVMLFAGDALLGNGEEFRSIDSDIAVYKEVTLPKFIHLLSKDITVFPGHGAPGKLPYILEKQGYYYGA